MPMLEPLPQRVVVYEVGPRDGLQNERTHLRVDQKLELIRALAVTGLKRIEVTSFVSPRWIPQLADADELARQLPKAPGVAFSALVPNEKGLERAREAGMKSVAVFLSSSQTHSQKNIHKSLEEALGGYRSVCAEARRLGMRVRGYVSTVWGCPYEGPVSVERSLFAAASLIEMGCEQVSLGDTIGVGTPRQTEQSLGAMLKRIPAPQLAQHMHDTRGTALANVLVGLQMGLTTFDAAVGGLGGCPYAPGAAGNLATEDLVYMLEGMGIETGVDMQRLVAAGKLAQRLIGRELPGKFLRAALAADGAGPLT
ncbi:MAG: hydroxymethylglutaryl-CoA lyase [Deltaproteobacteria bacterium]|nr:hydroxymethylglutaryl-CoA lyase [Deltaproteobacteria bacterium]